MQGVSHIISQDRNALLWLLAIIGAGIFGGVFAASAICILSFVITAESNRLKLILFSVILIFILADNFRSYFAFSQNLRFVVIGISLISLSPYYLLKNNKANLLIGFTVFALMVTLFYSPLGTPATLRSLGYLIVGVVIFKTFNLLNIEHRKVITNTLVYLLAGYFVLNLALFFFPIYPDSFFGGRFSGLMANPNGLGLLAMFTYALVFWVDTREETNFSRWFFVSFKLILFFLIIISASRTALLGVVAFELTNRFLQYHILLIIGLTGIVFLSIVLNNVETESLVRLLGLSDYLRVETLDTASGRTDVWSVAFEEFKKHPWLGQGMMYDNYFIDNYAEQRFGDNYARQWNGIWSSYLSLALNVGVIGLILFGYFWYRLYKSAKDKVFRVAFLVIILLSAITESWMAASMNAFMPLVFLIWALQIERPNPLEYEIESEESQ